MRLDIDQQPTTGRLVAAVDYRALQQQPAWQNHAQRVGFLGALQIAVEFKAKAPLASIKHRTFSSSVVSSLGDWPRYRANTLTRANPS
ncbi:hypothetical protein [Pseudomonas sp. MPC6]|uniref:hypothetical protein n=1 Tax=unclassified Pseudomonas TaxID=196821 RepID=UPI0013760A6E|nr:hypothetical protein [Pseudomonas sp. MPC6]